MQRSFYKFFLQLLIRNIFATMSRAIFYSTAFLPFTLSISFQTLSYTQWWRKGFYLPISSIPFNFSKRNYSLLFLHLKKIILPISKYEQNSVTICYVKTNKKYCSLSYWSNNARCLILKSMYYFIKKQIVILLYQYSRYIII